MNAPSIGLVLYATDDRIADTNWLTQFLQRNRCVFTIRNGSDPETHQSLVDRFGTNVELPGIVLDDCIWIPSDAEDLIDLVNEYVVDKLLCNNDEKQEGSLCTKKTETKKARRIPNGQDITKMPPNMIQPKDSDLMPLSMTTGSGNHKTNNNVRIMGKLLSNPGDKRISVPGQSTAVTVTELTRTLVAALPHSLGRVGVESALSSSSPQTASFVRGSDAIVIWRQLFGTNTIVGDPEWIRFGLRMVEHGILHCYTSLDADFRQAYLVLQPLRDARSLNTLIRWPACPQHGKSPLEDATHIVLRLSEMLDTILSHKCTNVLQDPLFLKFEEGVCELQGVFTPSEPKKKTTFALNLHNMIVRHAMILSTSNDPKWTWPTSLKEIVSFSEKIGYIVGNEFLSISALRLSLLGCTSRKAFPNIATSVTTKRMLHIPMLCGAKGKTIGGNYFDDSYVGSDFRILTAMSWGTKTSPVSQTVYPEHLDVGLQEAAENFCQTFVSVKNSGIELPTLFSWFRVDFGTEPAAVLRQIKNYLSVEQKQAVLQHHKAGTLQISFCQDDLKDWTCDLSAKRLLCGGNKDFIQLAAKPTELASMESITDASLYTSIDQAVQAPPVANAKDARKPALVQRSPAAVDIEISRSVLPPKDLKSSGVESKNKANTAGLHRQRMVGLCPTPTTFGSRQESRGDSMLFLPGREMKPNQREDGENSASTVATKNTRVDVQPRDTNNYWHPNLHATVSAMTFGSEFNLIVQSAAVRNCQVVSRKTCALPLYTL